MTKFKLLGVFFLACLLTLSRSNASELGHVTIVNGSYGGGWELTAQVTGETLVDLGLADSFTIKTLEGGAGSRALDMFLSEDQYKNSILVQSEPLISGFLKRSYQKGFRDLRPVALMAAEYTCLLVPNNAPYQNADDVLNVIKKNPASIPISLGGRYGTGDHIIANMIFKAGNVSNPTELRYIFSDGGDKATIRYLTTTRYVVGISGYNSIISEASKNKEIRVIGLTSEDSIDGHPTLREQGDQEDK
jgi:putative tricarboxylic transport membrane protein